MPRVLVTAFGPYDRYPANASWLTLVELTRQLPAAWQVITRLYPVDFDIIEQRIAADVAERPDYAILMGQSPGSSCIQLEAIAVNVAGRPEQSPDEYRPLAVDGPAAYQSSLPLGVWSRGLREQGIPAVVSHHAGTYLCNAALYLTHYLAERLAATTQAAFIHLPLDVSQIISRPGSAPSLDVQVSARAVRWILEQIMSEPEVPS